ncbi:MAG: sulfatase [Candidatus Nanohaloarchaea archaeon]
MKRYVAVLLLLAAVSGIQMAGFTLQKHPVVIVSIDTLRADRVTAAGYERNITPHLDEFVNDSYYFENAYASAPWTLPSHASIFTGKHNAEIGALSYNQSLCGSETTFAEVAERNGYRTVSFNGDGAVSANWNMDQGFDRYVEKSLNLRDNLPRAGKKLSGMEKPFLLFLHGYDVHSPYVVPGSRPLIYGRNYSGDIIETEKELEEAVEHSNKSSLYSIYFDRVNFSSKRDVQHLRDMYDNSIYYMDASLGSFMDRLKRNNLYDRSLVIVFSDHGEEFKEHGKIGHTQLYEETVRAFLAIKLPHQDSRKVVKERVELRKVFGVITAAVRGESLEKIREEVSDLRSRTVYVEDFEEKAVISGDYKLIVNHFNGTDYELYNLRKDPDETENLARKKPGIKQELLKRLERLPERNYSSYCEPEKLKESLFNR